MIGAIRCGIIFGLLFSDITAQDKCSNCICCSNKDCFRGGTCKIGCKDGYWGSKCDNTCTSHCVRCKRYYGNPCYECQPGYYKFYSNECRKCEYTGCTCSTRYRCDGCVEGYYDPSHYCRKCPSNCKQCTSSSYCRSCKQDRYGSTCQYQCETNCRNGVCDSEKTICKCNTGYAGIHCTDCVVGKFGSQCQNTCSAGCMSKECNGKTGTCSCRIGWTGSKCNICAPNYYGNQCSRRCRPECTKCHNYSSCQSCLIGRYGSYCQYSCGKGCLYNKYEKSNGQCLCKTNLFNGHYCVSCVDGKYGQDCNNDCPGSCHSCSEATACTSCKPGFFGSVCEHKCSESCESCSEMGQCLTCKTGNTHPDRQCLCQKNMCSTPDSCDQCVSDEYYPDSGSCCPCSLLQHCKSCRVTSNITKCIACEEGFYPNEIGECINCSLICIAGQCNSLTGECLIGCASNYWGQLCEHECKDSCNTCNRSNGECFECASKLTYGLNCNINCSETCVDKECYISGKCINGCLENNFGEMCDNECDKNCISNGNGTRCSSESGKCLHGCTPGYTSIVCPQVPEGETQTLSGSPAAVFSGGVAGAVILIITIIAVIAFFHHRKRRAENSTNKTTTLKTDQHEEQQVDSSAVYAIVNKNIVQSDAIYANTVDGVPQIAVISNQNFQRPSEKNTSSEMIYKEDNLEIDDEDAIARKIAIRFEENGGVYYNNSYEVNKTKVKVEELPAYVAGKTKSSYEEEFEKFPYGLTKPYEDSQKASSMSRNRYKGIYPYDGSRVKVWYNGSDYINASFIDGFKKRNEYIATLGPTSKQLGDFGLFWETVWQQKVEKVVMVTNLIEENKDKCDQYWPNVGSSARYGNVNVTCLSEDEYAEFTRRTFQISQNSEERKLHHFHFTCWPDRGVPEDFTSLIEFRQLVLNTSTKLNGPTVVHCSAGVGRTGTYCALDILTKEGKAEGSLDIPGCVLNMRQNRPNMIQTVGQYQFLHKALVHSLTLDCNPVKGERYQQFMDNLSDNDRENMFQQVLFTAEQYSEKESQAIERNMKITGKNRANADIPGDENRPRLNKGIKEGGSDYINAVFVNGHWRKKRFLVAQTPLPETVDDFLTLIYQESCSCIVSFETDIGNNESVGLYFPADNQVLNKTAFSVESLRQDGKVYNTRRTLMLRHTSENQTNEISIPQLEFTAWDSSRNTPRSASEFLDFIDDVEEASRASTSGGPILIHCIDGASKSGLFCVVSLLLQKMAIEHEVSVVNAVRKVKARRRLAIPVQSQLEFCHECVLAYIKSFENNMYSNFGETH
ncbi:receptor-type tyrosine-protein phosphatase mu-like isoform X2 [Mya arenaria]|uniref:receptor-type tyrosine-protein phosphatase mu-like isoform X2 n=1 Tax=Mya arenaria TaxID=6604 RepID=UPI0022E754B4|nr:receptor-type tyrosine-protein phosphatase mu-like isoform X2 [Mya arenaria]